MARPHKQGLDYFSLDVDFLSDQKFLGLRMRSGDTGVMIVIALLAEIYREGYALRPNVDELAYKFRISADGLSSIISAALEKEIFSPKIWDDFGVLTSVGIQKRFLRMTEKRTIREINADFWLLEEFPEKKPADNVGKTPQRKEKERERKEKENTPKPPLAGAGEGKAKRVGPGPIPTVAEMTFPEHLRTAEIETAFTGWIESRSEKKAPKSWSRFFQGQIQNILTPLTHADALATLRISAGNGWQGLVPQSASRMPAAHGQSKSVWGRS